jgi:hypothetical protein
MQPQFFNQKFQSHFTESPCVTNRGSKTSTFAKLKGTEPSTDFSSSLTLKPFAKKIVIKTESSKANNFSPTYSKSKKLLTPLSPTNKPGTPKALLSQPNL